MKLVQNEVFLQEIRSRGDQARIEILFMNAHGENKAKAEIFFYEKEGVRRRGLDGPTLFRWSTSYEEDELYIEKFVEFAEWVVLEIEEALNQMGLRVKTLRAASYSGRRQALVAQGLTNVLRKHRDSSPAPINEPHYHRALIRLGSIKFAVETGGTSAPPRKRRSLFGL